jgi:hypothetical protein
MESKHPIQVPQDKKTKAHLYVRFADVVWRLRPPCCTSCPRLPQIATPAHRSKHPISDQFTLSVEVAHNAMQPQSNTGAPSWPFTI